MDGGDSRHWVAALTRIAEALEALVQLQTRMLDLELQATEPAPMPEREPTAETSAECLHPPEKRADLGDGEWACTTCRTSFPS